jgi:hypothetical protein
VPDTASTAICSGLPRRRASAILSRMGTRSRETIYGASIRAAAERATEARKEADRLAVAAWNKRMLGFQGPAQPSPALYLEVKCLGCNTHQTAPWASCGGPRRHRSTNLNATCAARIAHGFKATVQAQPSGGAAADQDFRQRSGVNMVAGRA